MSNSHPRSVYNSANQYPVFQEIEIDIILSALWMTEIGKTANSACRQLELQVISSQPVTVSVIELDCLLLAGCVAGERENRI